MSNLVFPTVRGSTFPSAKTSEGATIIQVGRNRDETRIKLTDNAIYHWELTYDYLLDYPKGAGFPYTDLQKLWGFLLARKHDYDDFLYTDSDDNSVGPAIFNALPNLEAELQLIQDTTSGIWYSPVQRNIGGQVYEDITDLNPVPAPTSPYTVQPISVYANGVLMTQDAAAVEHDFAVIGPGVAIAGDSFLGLAIEWHVTPAGPITAEFDYYFRVRFEAGQQTFDKFLRSLWTIGGSEAQNSQSLKLMTSRPPAA
ncbi:MAG: hypothetical protein ACRDQZ_18965 [Mycobacteriales bacterium]